MPPCQKFAELIDPHWDGIASYCHPDNKISLALVEGISNKIQALHRRAFGYLYEEHLKRKTIATFLPS